MTLRGIDHKILGQWLPIRVLSILFNAALLMACAAPHANLSILDHHYQPPKHDFMDPRLQQVVVLLSEISTENPQLAYELGKLPEFQDWISLESIEALSRLVAIYRENPIGFRLAYEATENVGLPEVRKYNALLQALLWLAADGETKDFIQVITDFSVERLLGETWLLAHTTHINRWKWRSREAEKLRASCLDEAMVQRISDFERKNQGAVDFIISLAGAHPEAFGYRMRPFEPFLNRQRQRWRDFNMVADRVNAPELIHYFLLRDFQPTSEDTGYVNATFHLRAGDSCAIARLGAYLLERSGYPVFFHEVQTPDSPCEKRHCGAGVIIPDERFLLVVDFPKGKVVSGPFDWRSMENQLREGNCMLPRPPIEPIPIPERAPHNLFLTSQ
jgi:hypothetical protein